jgi:hypothetical protein
LDRVSALSLLVQEAAINPDFKNKLRSTRTIIDIVELAGRYGLKIEASDLLRIYQSDDSVIDGTGNGCGGRAALLMLTGKI